MPKLSSQLLRTAPTGVRANNLLAMSAVELEHDASDSTIQVPPRNRQIHKAGEVNISAYFPAEVKASLRLVQAKTGYNVKECLNEALRDLFLKHNVSISTELGKGR